MNRTPGQPLSGYLRAQLASVAQAIQAAKNEQIMMNEESYVNSLFQRFSIQPLQLHLERAEMSTHQRQVSTQDLPPNILYARGLSNYDSQPPIQNFVMCHIPFSGDKTLLQFDPASSCRLSLPKLNVENCEISFEVMINEHLPNEAANSVKRYNDWINQQVAYINNDLNSYNASLRPSIQNLVRKEIQSRTKLSQAITNINIPIRQDHKMPVSKSITTSVTSNEFLSVSLSYGGADIETAKKLKEFLVRNGVNTWFYPDNSAPGEKLHRMMSGMANDADRVIMLCSKKSLHSQGVLNELERTLEREAKEGGSDILIPITLDNYVFKEWRPERPDLAIQVRARNILTLDKNNFDGEATQALLEKLLLALAKK